MLGLRNISWDTREVFSGNIFRSTRKPVVHTRLCMTFNNLKQLPENILLSKSYDMSKVDYAVILWHNRHILAYS